MRLNWVDLLVLIVMLRTVYGAFKEGLSHEIFPLFASIASLLLALFYYEKIAAAAKNIPLPASVLNFVAFFIIVFLCKIVFKILKGILDALIKVTWHPLIERLGGLLAGLVRGAVVTSTILIVLTLLPLSYLQWSIRDKSMSGMYFLRIGPVIYETISRNPIANLLLSKNIISNKARPDNTKKKPENIPEWKRVSKL
jgi:uncharacterized membrane protein required for colicin V production